MSTGPSALSESPTRSMTFEGLACAADARSAIRAIGAPIATTNETVKLRAARIKAWPTAAIAVPANIGALLAQRQPVARMPGIIRTTMRLAGKIGIVTAAASG